MEFKYEVGDTFAWCDETRKIMARYKDENGKSQYAISYSEVAKDGVVSENHISSTYKKIEAFFEEGKKYHCDDDEKSWTCHVVTEVLGRKVALMTYGMGVTPTAFEQHEFKDYREV